jgi:hypothetical protein
MPPRRFPPPWTVEETHACFIVKDHAGMSLAYVYFEEEPGRRAAAKCSLGTRRGGSLPTLPSCRSCSAEKIVLQLRNIQPKCDCGSESVS